MAPLLQPGMITLNEMVPRGTIWFALWLMGPIWFPHHCVELYWKMVPPLHISTPVLLCVYTKCSHKKGTLNDPHKTSGVFYLNLLLLQRNQCRMHVCYLFFPSLVFIISTTYTVMTLSEPIGSLGCGCISSCGSKLIRQLTEAIKQWSCTIAIIALLTRVWMGDQCMFCNPQSFSKYLPVQRDDELSLLTQHFFLSECTLHLFWFHKFKSGIKRWRISDGEIERDKCEVEAEGAGMKWINMSLIWSDVTPENVSLWYKCKPLFTQEQWARNIFC